jgi:flagellar motility protein MotE (MotC chaperone)
MLKKLASPWIASALGVIVYLAVTVVTWQAATKNVTGAVQQSTEMLENEAPAAPWMVANPEVETLVKELRQQQENLNAREKSLNELADRLRFERTELNQLTQAVHRAQKDFEEMVSKVADDEAANLKKLAKTYAGMEPEACSAVFKKMEDGAVVKIMMFMRENETGPILAAMAKGSSDDAQRVADITQRLRIAVVPKKSTK